LQCLHLISNGLKKQRRAAGDDIVDAGEHILALGAKRRDRRYHLGAIAEDSQPKIIAVGDETDELF